MSSQSPLTTEQIEIEVAKAYPSLALNKFGIEASEIGLTMADVRLINGTINACRNRYRAHLTIPSRPQDFVFRTHEEVLKCYLSGVPIPENEADIAIYRQQVVAAMIEYADQFRIEPATEELSAIDKICGLMHDFRDTKQLHEARDLMYNLKHIIKTRMRK